MKLETSLVALAVMALGCSSNATSSATSGAGGAGGAGGATVTGPTTTSSASTAAASTTGTSTSSSSSSGSGGAGGSPPMKTLFIAGGQDLRRVISTDGKTWTNDVYVAPSGKDNAITCITSGKGVIVAAGDDGVWTSLDGIAWTKSADAIGQEHMHACVALHDGNQFVIVTGSRTLRSPDGLVWDKSDDAATGAGHWAAMAFGGGHYVAVGDGYRKVSEDAKTWHDFVQEPNALHGLVFASGMFVAVGDKGRHATSKDGKTWDNDVSEGDVLGDLQSLAFGSGAFVAMTCCNAVTSADGVTWQKQSGGVNGRVVFGASTFVGAGWRTNIAWSDDGKKFTNVFMGDGPNQFDANQQAPWLTTVGVAEIY